MLSDLYDTFSYECLLVRRSHCCSCLGLLTLRWRHNERDGASNHQHHDSLFKRLFRRRSKKTPKLRVTGLCEGNSPVTGEYPAQRASNAENVSIWWRNHAHHVFIAWNRREAAYIITCNPSLTYKFTHCALVTLYGVIDMGQLWLN